MQSNRRRVCLAELGRIVTGKTPPSSLEGSFGGRVPFITPSDYDGSKFIFRTARCLTSIGENAVRSARIPAGAVMVTCIGSDMGKVALNEREAFTNQQINSLIVEDSVTAEYVYYNLLMRKSELRAKASGSAQPILNKSAFGAVEIELPSIEEQGAIVSILRSLDSRINILRQTNATLESIAQALFKSWFIDFDPVRAKAEGREPEGMDAETAALFPDSFDDSALGEIPKGWAVSTVGQVAQCVGGGTPSTKEPKFWESAIHHWTTPKDLSGIAAPVLLDTERCLSDAGLAKVSSGLLPVGTLLMSSRAPIGYLAISKIPVAVNQGYIAMPPDGQLAPEYLYFWCQSNMDAIKQKANGSTFMEISKAAFRPIPIVLPSSEVASYFADLAGKIFERITEGERQRIHLEEMRDTLLPRLISGKLRLPEAESQLNEALA
nr:restriction endonuclease subunit S [Burkholderia stabilis]